MRIALLRNKRQSERHAYHLNRHFILFWSPSNYDQTKYIMTMQFIFRKDLLSGGKHHCQNRASHVGQSWKIYLCHVCRIIWIATISIYQKENINKSCLFLTAVSGAWVCSFTPVLISIERFSRWCSNKNVNKAKNRWPCRHSNKRKKTPKRSRL